jgi:mono/diheme cytochrome c family protein
LLISGTALVLGASAFPQVRSIELPEDNAMAELKPGPGVEVVRTHCVACHSTDYIVRQPHSDGKRWETEVKKMISAYGAPIDEADAKVIVEYLAAVYGPALANAAKEKTPSKLGTKAPETKASPSQSNVQH